MYSMTRKHFVYLYSKSTVQKGTMGYQNTEVLCGGADNRKDGSARMACQCWKAAADLARMLSGSRLWIPWGYWRYSNYANDIQDLQNILLILVFKLV